MTPNDAISSLQLPKRLQALDNHTTALIEQDPDNLSTIRSELVRYAKDVLYLAHGLSSDSKRSPLNWDDLDPQIHYMIYRYLFVHHEPISLEKGPYRRPLSLSAHFLRCNSDILREGRSILYGCNTIQVSHRPSEALYRRLPENQLLEIRKVSIKASHLSKTRLDELEQVPRLQELILYNNLDRPTHNRLGGFNNSAQQGKLLADAVLGGTLDKYASLRRQLKTYLDDTGVRCVFGLEIAPRFLGGNAQVSMFFAMLVDTDNSGITTSAINLIYRDKFFKGAR